MITSASDFDFVTGITNGEVLINGHIMPWRDYNYSEGYSPGTDKPQCLRGEDLCFLREGIMRRNAIGVYGTQTMWAYTPKVDGIVLANNIFGSLNSQYQIAHSNPSFFTVSTFPDKILARGNTGYGNGPDDGYPEYLMTNAMMVSKRSDFLEYDGMRRLVKPLRADNMRKLFYDFGRAKCQYYEPTYINQDLAKDFQQTAQVQAGDSSAESGTPGIYPMIPTSGYRSDTILFGELQTTFRSGTKYYGRARSYTRTAPTTFTLDWNQEYFNFSDYATCPFALVYFWTYGSYGGSYSNNIYNTATIQSKWTTVPATLDNSTVKVALSDLLSAGWTYANSCGVTSQYFTRGRGMAYYSSASSWGTTFGLDVYCAVHPIFFMKDLDYSYWTWTPPQN